MVETTEINQTQVKINAMRFTADRQRVIATTTNGFMIIDTATGEVLKACTAFEDGGLHICAPYGRTSIFFVVGTGSGASELRTCLIIWDDANNKKQNSIAQPSPASVKNDPATTNIGLGLNYQENQNKSS